MKKVKNGKYKQLVGFEAGFEMKIRSPTSIDSITIIVIESIIEVGYCT